MDYKKLYEEWLANPYFDENTKAELKAIEKDENEIKERFIKSWSLVQPVCAVSLVQVQTV